MYVFILATQGFCSWCANVLTFHSTSIPFLTERMLSIVERAMTKGKTLGGRETLLGETFSACNMRDVLTELVDGPNNIETIKSAAQRILDQLPSGL